MNTSKDEFETAWQTYKRVLCKNCKNRNTDLCEIRQCVDGTYKCIHYEKDGKN